MLKETVNEHHWINASKTRWFSDMTEVIDALLKCDRKMRRNAYDKFTRHRG